MLRSSVSHVLAVHCKQCLKPIPDLLGSGMVLGARKVTNHFAR